MEFINKFFLALFIIYCITNIGHSADLGIIYDAVFSPDSSTLAVGTSTGLYLYDYPSIDLKHHESFADGGVHFIKWAPDRKYLVAAVWREDENQKSNPVYYIYDLTTHTKVSSFEDHLRWIKFYKSDFDSFEAKQWINVVFEDIYPISNEIAHVNTIAFSPDGTELVLLGKNNQLIVRSIPSSNYKRALTFGEYKLYSVGNAVKNEECWIGIDNGPLLFVNRETGGIAREVKGPSNALYVSESEKIALIESPYYMDDHNNEVFLSLYLNNSETGAMVSRLLGDINYGIYHLRFQVLPDSQEIFVFYPHFYTWDTHIKRYKYTSSPTVQVTETSDVLVGGFDIVEELVLAQPFSPDGKVLLQMDLNKLYAVDTQVSNPIYRQILPKVSQVEDSLLYNNDQKGNKP